MATLNLGILAHVDAGKTTLTERLLYAAGVIDKIGSVDDGTTQTDSLALERQRGITIKSAVVSFDIDDLAVNLIDTPGHPDFIAEVERVLAVLDGAVLVISAVEGVQAQTRVLMRTLQRLRIPTLLFVNKIDRSGAAYRRVLRAITERLTPAAIPMGTVERQGQPGARFQPYGPADRDFTARLLDTVAEHDDALLAAYVEDEAAVTYPALRAALAAQTGQVRVHPVYAGSAITGAGVGSLTTGIRELLPRAGGDATDPVSGAVFKVERGPAGERIAYVRLFAGTIRVRDRIRIGPEEEAKVVAIRGFERGPAEGSGTAGDTATAREAITAGQIGALSGLGGVRIGDPVGVPRSGPAGHQFPPPTLAAVVLPRRPADRARLHDALSQLAEHDPLIALRPDETQRELSVSLYGEVQKEVLQATLAADYGIEVDFGESTTLCIERPAGTGEAVERLQEESNPFRASIGLRVEPAPAGSGIGFRLRIDPRTAPIHLYKNLDGFADLMAQYVRTGLREGLAGWPVTDCTVTLVECGYSVADGPPSVRGPDSTPADFRRLTPLVVMRAVARAGTRVCEPVHRYRLEIPAGALGAVLPALARLDAAPQAPVAHASGYVLTGDIPAARVHQLHQRLSGLTRGEGLLESSFDHYRPVRGGGPIPTRPRTGPNPLDRKQYLRQVLGRVSSG